MLKSAFFLTTLFLFLFLDNLNATNYYVSTTGNNGNAGTFGSPFATIAHAYSLASAGDSVIVMPGTYKETWGDQVCFEFNRNGTASLPIVVKSQTKGGAILDGQMSTTYKYVMQIRGNYNVISGFKVTNGSFYGITVQGGHNKVTYCEIYNNGTAAGSYSIGQGAIYEGNGAFHGTYMYNYLHHNGRTPGGGDHGFYIQSDSVLIAYNIITFESDAGVNTKAFHTFIYNNTFAHNGHGIGISLEDPNYPSDIQIINNIFYLDTLEGADYNNINTYNNGQGLAIHDPDPHGYSGFIKATVHNNLFAEKDNNIIYKFEIASPHNAGTLWYTGTHAQSNYYGNYDTTKVYEYYTRNLFVNDGTDYRLASGSNIAVNNGYNWQTTWGITTDYAGNTKNGSNWDIGALQHSSGVGGGGGGTLPTATLKLTVFIEALYVAGGTAMTVSQWVTVELHSSSTPYALVDLNSAALNSTGVGIFTFTKAVSGTNYYIVVKSMNTIATWSATPHSFTSSALNYNFTTAVTQAYRGGSNPPLALHNGKYCVYSGDLNQDGFVNKADYTGVDNDNSTFSYHTVNDLNGDGLVSSADEQFIDNNYILSIHRQAPAGAQ